MFNTLYKTLDSIRKRPKRAILILCLMTLIPLLIALFGLFIHHAYELQLRSEKLISKLTILLFLLSFPLSILLYVWKMMERPVMYWRWVYSPIWISFLKLETLFEKISEIFDLIHDERFQKKYSDFLESLKIDEEVDEDFQKLFDIDLSSNTKFGFKLSDLLKDDSYSVISG